ncbi:MAG: dethiobiotin synthase, partial [Betaproteobacteria bacterium]|nr:dethiobiotin synthase [Betaproteobacteria bacterium]
VEAPLALVNPYCFEPPIAPHLAAEQAGVVIDLAIIAAAFERLAAIADIVIVEGVGGFCVPLNRSEDSADLAQRLGLPVILVVGLRLGCLNHALLTARAIRAQGLTVAGWIANRIDPAMAAAERNVAALAERLAAPLLGVVEFMAAPDPGRIAAQRAVARRGRVHGGARPGAYRRSTRLFRSRQVAVNTRVRSIAQTMRQLNRNVRMVFDDLRMTKNSCPSACV